MLESMLSNSNIREVSPTTKRLVERCLSGDWCVQLVELRKDPVKRPLSPSSDASSSLSPPATIVSMPIGNVGSKSLKQSKSVEILTSARFDVPKPTTLRSPLDQIRRPSNSSVPSLPALATPLKNVPGNAQKKRSFTLNSETSYPSQHISNGEPPLSAPSPISESIKSGADHSISKPHRRPPPVPPKRRKPPAIPIGRTNGGAVMTSIRSSEPSPLSKVHKPPIELPVSR